jgi:hypothetical protein
MATPPLLFCDTDCVIQLFISNQTSLLRWLKTRYSLGAVVVPEVENELSWHAKFKGRFDQDLRRAVSNGLLEIFDYSRPDELSVFFPVPHAATAASNAITKTGNEYALKIGTGEAYSHAACIHLGMPLLSHDKSAIDTLLYNNLQTAAPVLRVFDLVVIGYEQGTLSVKACDSIRQILGQSGEFVPKAFKRASFEQGLRTFDARLHELPANAAKPAPCQNFNDVYLLDPT